MEMKVIDFGELFSPMVKMSSIIVGLKIATSSNLKIGQLYVRIFFFRDDLEEETYIKKLEGFKIKGKKTQCWKTLYDKKQAPI